MLGRTQRFQHAGVIAYRLGILLPSHDHDNLFNLKLTLLTRL